MTWLDILLIAIWIFFMAVGARLGTVWTTACLMGGFLGAVLVDYYALPLAGFLGQFTGVHLVSSLLLYIGALILVLAPGYLVGRLSSFFLGFIDSVFGLLTGALIGFITITVCLLLVVPLVPRVEKGRAWKKSLLVRPLQQKLEEIFNHPHFGVSPLSFIKGEAMETLSPVAKEATDKAIHLAEDAVQKLKK